jgi:hypothetical protein
MNLRIDLDSVRLRLDVHDLDELIRTKRLEASTQIVEGLSISYIVKFAPLPEECIRNLLHLDGTRTQEGIVAILTVSPEGQQILMIEPPTKEGLKDFKTLPDGSMLTIALEVDTKSQRTD